MSDSTPVGAGSHSREIPAGFLALFAGLAAVGLVILVLVLQSLYSQVSEQEVYRKVLSQPNPQLLELRQREQAALTGYKVLDPSKGVYQVPIDRAMELVVRDYAARGAARATAETSGGQEPGGATSGDVGGGSREVAPQPSNKPSSEIRSP